jgi:hypothetical protein
MLPEQFQRKQSIKRMLYLPVIFGQLDATFRELLCSGSQHRIWDYPAACGALCLGAALGAAQSEFLVSTILTSQRHAALLHARSFP